MIYFDTAYLAKCYLHEYGSAEVRKLAAESGKVACCTFGQLELAATIHRNLREGKITPPQSRIVYRQIDLDEENRIWTWLPVNPELLEEAKLKFRTLKPDLYLRSADALHLACAAQHGIKELFSNDQHLLAAATAFKIKGRNVID